MSRGGRQGYAAVIQALPEPAALVTSDGIICATNAAFQRLLKHAAAATHELPLVEVVIDDPTKVAAYLQNCARSRQPVLGTLTLVAPPSTMRTPDAAPTYRCEGAVVEPWTPAAPALVLLRLRPRESILNRFLLLNSTIENLHEEVRERRQAEARLRVLAEVSAALATSLEPHTLLQQVAALVVGHFADWCMIYLRGATGIERVATAHVDPAKMELANRLAQRSPHYSVPDPFVRVIESGESLFAPYYDEATVLTNVTNAEQLAIIRRINPQSVIAVPLEARGSVLGTLALVWSENERHYDEADLRLAEELARRTALVVENARLYDEARSAELQLRDFNHTLEQLVAERTHELQRSNHELDQFAYVASHDLKAPLRGIDHLSQWVEDDAGHALPAMARGHLVKLRERVARMERLLDDLLAYSRVGRQSHAAEQVDCAQLVQGVAELLSPPTGFVITVASSLPVLHTQRVPLETVFRNLISNAIKHHHHPAAGEVEVRAQLRDDLVEFAVTDNGPGIEARFHERIFQIFQVLKPRDQTGNSGVGLAVVKKIVERRGGAVWVESEVEKGTTFRFTWPLHEQAWPGRTGR